MRPLVWFIAMALAVSLSACSSDAETDAGPTPSASTPTESESAGSGSEETEPAVPVADGPERVLDDGRPGVGDLVRYRLPTPEWKINELTPGGGFLRLPDNSTFTVSGLAYKVVGDTTISEFRRGTIERTGPPEDPRVKVAPNRTVGGERGYVVRGEGPQGLFYEFGTFWRDQLVTLQFSFPRGGERSEEWIESVLASVEWL